MFDVFISYRHADTADVAQLVGALRGAGLRVWMDESGIETFASIQQGIETGLDQSRVLLAWYSARYPASLACQWELTRAFIAGQAEGDPRRRVLLINPEPQNTHIHPIELRDALYLARPGDAAARDAAIAAIARHVQTVTTAFADIRPGAKPRWFGAASGDGSNRFVGRVTELWAIHSGLQAAEVPIIQNTEARALVTLSGMAGSGKSLTAETYGIRFGTAYPDGVFWLKAFGHDAEHPSTAETRQAHLEDQLLELSTALGLRTEHLSPEQVRSQLAAALANAAPYLWVVDDLPSKVPWKEVQPWLAPSREGRTLITTRGTSSGWAGTRVTLNELDDLSAFALLTRLRPPAGAAEEAEARALMNDLGGLALGVELAAVLVQKRGYAAVRASIAAPARDVLDLAASLLTAQGEELPHRDRANLSLSAALSLSIDNLDERARDLLRLAALVAAAPIPRRLIVETFAAANGTGAADAEDSADLAVAAASAESLVREPAPGSCLVHSLVSRTLRLRDREPAMARWQQLREGAVTAIDTVLDDGVGDLRRHAEMAGTVVHARALLAPVMAGGGQIEPLEGRVLDGLYVYDFVRGNYREARRIADRLIANATAVIGPEHPYTLMFRSYVGSLLFAQGDLAGALAEHMRIYDVRLRVLGPGHPGTLSSMNDAALVLYRQGDLARARAMQEQVLAGRLDTLGPQHLDTATAMNNLASTLSDLGEPEAAIELQRQVIALRTNALGEDHAETLSALGNLAVMQRASGAVAAARSTQDAIDAAGTAVLGDDHPQALTALHNLAATLYSQGDLPGARDAAARCLEGRRRVLGADHPDTLATENNLGAILMGLQPSSEARTMLEDALERCRRVLGASHPQTLQAAFHLVLTLVRSNDASGRIRDVVAHDLAPLAAMDPQTLPPELRDIRERMAPILAQFSQAASAPPPSTPWWRRMLGGS